MTDADQAAKYNSAFWLSTIRASLDLSRGRPLDAVQHLEKASPYELLCCTSFAQPNKPPQSTRKFSPPQ
jgi:hypothetical protein